MTGTLNNTQMQNVLVSQAIGRIGFCNGKQPYVVPVTYAYDGEYIYGQSTEGMKLDMMRNNPMVCLQVDHIFNMANWQSVMVTGEFQELKGKTADKARAFLYDRVLPLMTSSTIHAHEHEVTGKVDDSHRIKPVVYRIKIKKMAGRFEKQ